MVMSTPLRTSPVQHGGNISIIKADNDLVIAGYASVEMVDKQGDLITRSALKNAFGDFMKAEDFRNVQLAHSNIQVGSVIPSYTDNEGRVWKSSVDDAGMFVVIKLRNDIEKAREVANEIRKGNLRGFSIGGQAFKRMRKSDSNHGDYTEISKLELHEVTICEKGINPEATFRILKEDTSMTEENNALTELASVIDRVNTRMDAMEKADLPPFMDKDEKSTDDDDGDDSPKDKESEDEDDTVETKKSNSQYSDIISSEYLSWMENTLKSQGVDTGAARTHFDSVNKANLGSTPEQLDEAAMSGQVKGRATEGGSPSTGAIGKIGSGAVAKGYLHPSTVSASDIEAAYEVYKAASMEQQFKSNLNSVFSDRLQKELIDESEARAAGQFDARGPLGDIQKAIASLGERIDNMGTVPAQGSIIQKSTNSNVEIPSTEELGTMDWSEVHQLAGSVWN
jgi:HK97 family phage prohead protease